MDSPATRHTAPRRFPGPAGALPPLTVSLDQLPHDAVVSPFNVASSAVGAVPGSPLVSNTTIDFNAGPWVAMSDAHGGLLKITMKVSDIKKKRSPDKIPLVAVVVTKLSAGDPNARATMADPSGSILGSVHAKALAEYDGILAPGCALLLQAVSVLMPSPRNVYLNITSDNIVQVYGLDGRQSPMKPIVITPIPPKPQAAMLVPARDTHNDAHSRHPPASVASFRSPSLNGAPASARPNPYGQAQAQPARPPAPTVTTHATVPQSTGNQATGPQHGAAQATRHTAILSAVQQVPSQQQLSAQLAHATVSAAPPPRPVPHSIGHAQATHFSTHAPSQDGPSYTDVARSMQPHAVPGDPASAPPAPTNAYKTGRTLTVTTTATTASPTLRPVPPGATATPVGTAGAAHAPAPTSGAGGPSLQQPMGQTTPAVPATPNPYRSSAPARSPLSTIAVPPSANTPAQPQQQAQAFAPKGRTLGGPNNAMRGPTLVAAQAGVQPTPTQAQNPWKAQTAPAAPAAPSIAPVLATPAAHMPSLVSSHATGVVRTAPAIAGLRRGAFGAVEDDDADDADQLFDGLDPSAFDDPLDDEGVPDAKRQRIC